MIKLARVFLACLVLLFLPLIVMRPVIGMLRTALYMMVADLTTPLLDRPVQRLKTQPQKWCFAFLILFAMEALMTMYPTVYYVPKSQRNLTSRAIRQMFRHGQQAVHERMDIYNWKKAELEDEGLQPSTLTVLSALLCHSAEQQIAGKEREAIFDTDSGLVGIDNRCTACISHDKDDFVGPLRETDRVIKGFGGAVTRKLMIGTISWKWTDDDGKLHRFIIKDSYYVPHGKLRLLSPQHWAQQQRDRKPTYGTGETTDEEKCVLFWKQKKFNKTVYLDRKRSNVATMRLAPGYNDFNAFCTEIGIESDVKYEFNPIIAKPAAVSDDEEELSPRRGRRAKAAASKAVKAKKKSGPEGDGGMEPEPAG